MKNAKNDMNIDQKQIGDEIIIYTLRIIPLIETFNNIWRPYK